MKKRGLMRGTRKTKTNQTDLEGMKGRTGLEWPERGEWMRSEQQKQAYGIEMGEGVYAVTEAAGASRYMPQHDGDTSFSHRFVALLTERIEDD